MKTVKKVHYSLRTSFEKRKKILAIQSNSDFQTKKSMGRAVKSENVRGGMRRMRGRPRTREIKQPSVKKQRNAIETINKEREDIHIQEESMSPTQQEPPKLEPMPAVEEDADLSLRFPSLICIDDHLRPGKCILLCSTTGCRKRFSNPLELVSHLRTYHTDVNAFEKSENKHDIKSSLTIYACPLCLPTQFSTHTTSSDLTLLSEHAVRYHGQTISSNGFVYFCTILLELLIKENEFFKDNHIYPPIQELKQLHKSNTMPPQISRSRITKKSKGTSTGELSLSPRPQPKVYAQQSIIIPTTPPQQNRLAYPAIHQPTFIPISPVQEQPHLPVTSSLWGSTVPIISQPTAHSMPVLALAAAAAAASSTSSHIIPTCSPAYLAHHSMGPILLPTSSASCTIQPVQHPLPLHNPTVCNQVDAASHSIFLQQNRIPMLLPTSTTTSTSIVTNNSSNEELQRCSHSTSIETAEAIATIQHLIATASNCTPSYPPTSFNPATTNNQISQQSFTPPVHRSPPVRSAGNQLRPDSVALQPLLQQLPVRANASFLQPLRLGDSQIKTMTTNSLEPYLYPSFGMSTKSDILTYSSSLRQASSFGCDGSISQIQMQQPLSCTVSSSNSGMDWEPDGQLSPSSGLLALACLSVKQAAEFSNADHSPNRSLFSTSLQETDSVQKTVEACVTKGGRNRRLLPRKFNKYVINEQSNVAAIFTPTTSTSTTQFPPVVCVTRRQLKAAEPTTVVSKPTASRKRGLAPLAVKPPKESTSKLLAPEEISSTTNATFDSIITCQALTELSSVVGSSANSVGLWTNENPITVNSIIRRQHNNQHMGVKSEDNPASPINLPLIKPLSFNPSVQPLLPQASVTGAPLYSPSKSRFLSSSSYVAVQPRPTFQRTVTIRPTPLQKILPRPHSSGTTTGGKEVRSSRPAEVTSTVPTLTAHSSSSKTMSTPVLVSSTYNSHGNNKNNLRLVSNLNGSPVKSSSGETSVAPIRTLVVVSSEGQAS